MVNSGKVNMCCCYFKVTDLDQHRLVTDLGWWREGSTDSPYNAWDMSLFVNRFVNEVIDIAFDIEDNW